ncbi:MAG: FtsX-like permease family protein [Candidatus Dormibacteraeota bacterium]|uniref:ABC transporter permease n=1 Tax=Candidatus Aeolococcus gillhamiae TaxID=3127015 RepID=A0A2W5Z8M8_9BACT|nr:FtsX-like permease family protein [Candidatus Dormibacteraeota bacterium]PZR81633.1 MAG: ABC transporter permease [Candidatus Dormibacter sp. RRmetagenome_bin12]
MVWLLWMRGLLRHRFGRTMGTALGIAVAVALLASIGSFLAASQATMTTRAVATVAVDWQIEVQRGADAGSVLAAVRSQPGLMGALPVGYGDTSGLTATTGTTTQTTGAGVVVGLPNGYASTFPGEIRPLVGSATGVLLAQQTAATLRVHPGDQVGIGRPGMAAATVTVAGVVDLPQASSLFQKVGAPRGAQPSAPPDNVVLVPLAQWHVIFDPLQATAPGSFHQQVHAHHDRNLPSSPESAFEQVAAGARNLEVRLAGAGLVADNMGAALDAARSDAAYATVIFLFLGLPGAVIAGLLTAAVGTAGVDRRRRDQALLRSRGASISTLVTFGISEAAIAGIVGAVVGVGAALLLGLLFFGSASFGADARTAAFWTGLAAAAGIVIALLVVAVPAWRDARRLTVSGARMTFRRGSARARVGLGLALVLLGLAAITYVSATQKGYTLVLAPEGVPSISVNYLAFAGPACLWVGSALLTWRAAAGMLQRLRRPIAGIIRPIAGPLARTVVSSMGRERRRLAQAAVLVGLAAAFAASTAVFNSTYAQQAQVDARLTNGADVTVTAPPGTNLPAAVTDQVASVRGVHGVEPMIHRFAYVGADLQDMFGVRASTITAVGRLQDAYFQGGTATQVMARLAAQRDGLLISAETVKDFQLSTGDRVTLRLPRSGGGGLVPVIFHYVGIVSEFPTAPRDSFLIANLEYVAQATADLSANTLLIDTGDASPPDVAGRVRQAIGPGPNVQDIVSTRQVVGSSLTAVDLTGLTRVELGFAIVLAIGATGLLLSLSLAERRRTYVLAAALGARPGQLRAFVWSEAGFVVTVGLVAGLFWGWLLSHMLVSVLTGVFDPPPAALAVPWGYLAATLATSLLAVILVVVVGSRVLRRAPLSALRDF